MQRSVGGDDRVAVVERGIALGVILAQVRAAALGTRERTAGDQPGQWVRVVQQAAQTRLAAHYTRVAPEGRARVVACDRRGGPNTIRCPRGSSRPSC